MTYSPIGRSGDPSVLPGQMNMFLAVRKVGERVELAPHLDLWAAGDRFGTIESIGRFYLHVRMDKSGRTVRVVPENVKEISA